MTDSADTRFAPPTAHVEDVKDVATGEVELATRARRFGAAVLDALILGGIFWALGLLPGLEWLHERDRVIWSLSVWHPTKLVVQFILFFVVNGFLLVTSGQTVGKWLCKLRIVRGDGSRPEAWRLLGLRYGIGYLLSMNAVMGAIFGLADHLLIFRESRKCLHDNIAGTKVIKV